MSGSLGSHCILVGLVALRREQCHKRVREDRLAEQQGRLEVAAKIGHSFSKTMSVAEEQKL